MTAVHDILGVPVAALDMDATVDACLTAIEQDTMLQVGVVNAAKLVNAQKDPVLRDALLECPLIVADGQAVVWASKLLGTPLPARVAGIDLFLALLSSAADNGHRVFFLGATDDVVAGAVREAERRLPGLQVAGSHHGYYDEADSREIAEKVAASGAEMLFLGMTSPKKEIFVAQHGAATGARVIHGVGGSFDILAGKTKRAPEALQRAGLEWAYRVYQEPRRMWRRYLVTNTEFCRLVARESWRRSRSSTGRAA